MLPPISTTAPARTAQTVREPLAGQVAEAIVTDAERDAVPPTDSRTVIQERLTTLALSGQLAGGRGVLNVTDMIGSLLDIERQPNETLAGYADRLLEALKALSPATQNSLQKALAQWVRSMALDVLMQALHNPDGPEATKLAAQLETLGMDKDLVQRQISAGYAENEADAFPRAPRLSTQFTSASAANLAEPPRPNSLPAQMSGQAPFPLRLDPRIGLAAAPPETKATLSAATADTGRSDGVKNIETVRSQSSQSHSDTGKISFAAGAPSATHTPQTSASGEFPDPLLGGASGANPQPSTERLKSGSAPESPQKVPQLRLPADAATIQQPDLDDQNNQPALSSHDNQAQVRNSGSSQIAPDRFGPSLDNKDSQIAKALLLNSLVVEQLEEGVLGGEPVGRAVTRIPAAATSILAQQADDEALEPARTNPETQRASAESALARDASEDYSAAGISLQPVATLSLTAALVQDESALAGLAQALVQMRAVLGQAILPPHVLYPAEDRGEENDDEVRVMAVDAEDEDRHQKRQNQDQSGSQQSRDERQDQNAEQGLTTVPHNAGPTSSLSEPADFYHKLGGW